MAEADLRLSKSALLIASLPSRRLRFAGQMLHRFNGLLSIVLYSPVFLQPLSTKIRAHSSAAVI
jgi:hypothetical protein